MNFFIIRGVYIVQTYYIFVNKIKRKTLQNNVNYGRAHVLSIPIYLFWKLLKSFSGNTRIGRYSNFSEHIANTVGKILIYGLGVKSFVNRLKRLKLAARSYDLLFYPRRR